MFNACMREKNSDPGVMAEMKYNIKCWDYDVTRLDIEELRFCCEFNFKEAKIQMD